MGAWGPAIFSDDLACDVRAAYREMLEDGVDDDVAVERTLEQFEAAVDDPDEGPVFWLALAVTQSKVGRLRDEVKQRALEVVETGEGLDRWDDAKARRQRQAALAKTRAVLEGPQPDRRRLRPPSRHVTSLRAGDVLSIDIDGTFLLLRVARIDDDRLSVAPILVALDFEAPSLPSERRLRRLRDRKPIRSNWRDPVLPKWRSTTFRVSVHRKVDYTDAGLVVVAQLPEQRGDSALAPRSYCTWTNLPRVLRYNVTTES